MIQFTKVINVNPNLNIFTLYCYLNTVGYDDENNRNGMHPKRIEIRHKLFETAKKYNTDAFINFFTENYINKKIHLFHFNACSLSLSDDEQFSVINNNYSTGLLPDLNKMLKDFYNHFNIKELWEGMTESHRIICEKYQVVSENIIKTTQDYFYEKQKEKTEITIIPNLLESYFRNKSILINDNLYLLIGPYKNNGTHTEGIIHEYIHLLVNPVIEKYEKLINNKERYFNRISKTKQITGSYNNWRSYISESTVRALALAVYKDVGNLSDDVVERSLNTLNEQGFLLSKKLIEIINSCSKPQRIELILNKLLDTLS